MVILKARCRICKSIQDHEKIEEFDQLPAYVVCIKCIGCGVMGIEMLDETKAVDCE